MDSMDDVYGSSRPYESHNEQYACNPHAYMRPAAHNIENVQEAGNRPHFIRWKSGKRVDPRLLTLLESFREVHVERREFFRRIFPGLYDDFGAVFKKLSAAMLKDEETRSRTLERSKSFGTLRAIGHSEEESEPPVLERFKVKAPNIVIVAGSDDGQGSQSDNDDKGPSNSK